MLMLRLFNTSQVIGFEPIQEWNKYMRARPALRRVMLACSANTATWGELDNFLSIQAGAGACDEMLPFVQLRQLGALALICVAMRVSRVAGLRSRRLSCP